MAFPVLQNYLARLSHVTQAATSVRLDAEGRAQGRFFNCTMTSAFQPLRCLAASADGAGQGEPGAIVAYEGLARSVSAGDAGLSLWKLLDHAASDDESIELDRLCRMLHAINFFRQPEAQSGQPDLYLNVHDRLLSAVSSNHGHAFQRILEALELPLERIVLQLPAVTPNQGWLLNYVADNYRRNGFRLAINVGGVAEAVALLERVRPDVVKMDVRHVVDEAAAAALLLQCQDAGVALVFKKIDTPEALARLRRVVGVAAVAPLVQGYLLDLPAPNLLPDWPAPQSREGVSGSVLRL